MLKNVEIVLFRFACLAAVGASLFFVAAFIANAPEDRALPLILVFAGPAAIMVTFYTLRWAFTGRLKPWLPTGDLSKS